MEIQKRITLRNAEPDKIKRLAKYLNEDDLSKVYAFAIDQTIWYLENVTNTFFPENWDVLFRRKRATNPLGRKIF